VLGQAMIHGLKVENTLMQTPIWESRQAEGKFWKPWAHFLTITTKIGEKL
jgi:hypothetical protein